MCQRSGCRKARRSDLCFIFVLIDNAELFVLLLVQNRGGEASRVHGARVAGEAERAGTPAPQKRATPSTRLLARAPSSWLALRPPGSRSVLLARAPSSWLALRASTTTTSSSSSPVNASLRSTRDGPNLSSRTAGSTRTAVFQRQLHRWPLGPSRLGRNVRYDQPDNRGMRAPLPSEHQQGCRSGG